MAIVGAHIIVFSRDADADREFFRDVLGFGHIDVGGGWLIFSLPPAEIAMHPTDATVGAEIYLMCDDLVATMSDLTSAGVDFSVVEDEQWGRVTRFHLPGGAEVGLYQPSHPTAHDL